MLQNHPKWNCNSYLKFFSRASFFPYPNRQIALSITWGTINSNITSNAYIDESCTASHNNYRKFSNFINKKSLEII